MSHQLSECPGCRRAFIGDAEEHAAPRPGRCRACGTPLISPSEKEAEVQDRLYGRHLSTESVTRVPMPAER
jgi:uncharacterized protein with PIN domain